MVENVTVSGKPETFENTALKVIVSKKSIEDNKRTSENDEQDKSKKRPRTEAQQNIFRLAFVLSLIIVVPYAWYAIRIYNYAHENKPDGFDFPRLSQFWVILLGMSALGTLRIMVK